MAKVLTRPMFKRGGIARNARNTGILSGFEDGGNVRRKFAGEDGSFVYNDLDIGSRYSDMDARLKALQETNVKPQGLSRSDYLRIAAAGANIMGAPPTGRGGVIGALQAAGPALSELGTGLAESYDTKQAAYLKRQQELESLGLSMDAQRVEQQITADQAKQTTLAEIHLGEFKATKTLEAVKYEVDNKKFEFTEKLDSYIDLAGQIGIVQNQIADAKIDKKPTAELEAKLASLNTQIQIPLEGTLGQRALQEMITGTPKAVYEAIYDNAVEAAEAVGAAGSDAYNEKLQEVYTDSYRIHVQSMIDAFKGVSFSVAEEKAEGGRVGLANGGGPYEPGSGPDPDPGSPPIMTAARGPYEPGSGPDPDPNSPPIITAEELRKRLPPEVSDSVIQLIATSEEAMLDFARIQSPEDINTFNRKYNADLVLPTQVA
tara:strand:+ start:637 stop:1929 length:1293 start_codon:yes stop_codon:yes gene_type:complete